MQLKPQLCKRKIILDNIYMKSPSLTKLIVIITKINRATFLIKLLQMRGIGMCMKFGNLNLETN